jgi:hypothetical protein
MMINIITERGSSRSDPEGYHQRKLASLSQLELIARPAVEAG